MPQRLVLHFDIADRQLELRHSVAPDDFVLLRRETPLPFPAGSLAYCADQQAERVLYSLHGDALWTLFSAPFLYSAQLLAATGVVSVPYEQLAALEPAGAEPRPTLIFSPGRTGSTLLARLLAAAGEPCASEPDMLSQVCRFGREDRRRIGLPMETALLRACLVSLCAALGPAPFIKLRSHCNARPLALLEAAPLARPVFMLRRLLPWALSRHRTFGEPPASVAAILRTTLDALDKLTALPAPLTILWFETLRQDPAATLHTLTGRVPDQGAIAAVIAADAQAGTPIARSRVASQGVDADFEAAFDAAWQDARASAAWSDTTLGLLAEMAG